MQNESNWIKKCQRWKEKWNTYVVETGDDEGGVNFYTILESLNEYMVKDDVLISDSGTSFYITGQAAKISDGVRLVLPGAQADMGFSLPASIGVGMTDRKYNPIIITGDGSFQTNIQELATIKEYKIRTKMLIINNQGYLSIRNTQSKFFNTMYGSSVDSGLWFPDLKKIAETYDIKYFKISKNEELYDHLQKFLHIDEPIIFDIQCKYSQELYPVVSLKTMPDNTLKQCGLEDMAPFLSQEELESELNVV